MEHLDVVTVTQYTPPTAIGIWGIAAGFSEGTLRGVIINKGTTRWNLTSSRQVEPRVNLDFQKVALAVFFRN